MPSPNERQVPPEPWHSFLSDLDAIATEQTDLQCMGGFVITLLYGLARPTADVDVLSIAPVQQRTELMARAGKGAELHKKHGVYLDYVGVSTVPLNYEERLLQIFPVYKQIRLFALEPHDLALSKLERNIGRDREDVRYLARTIPLNFDVLRKRYQEEFRPYAIGRKEDHDLTFALWIEMIEEDRNGPKN